MSTEQKVLPGIAYRLMNWSEEEEIQDNEIEYAKYVAVMNSASVKELKLAIKKKVNEMEQSRMGHRHIPWLSLPLMWCQKVPKSIQTGGNTDFCMALASEHNYYLGFYPLCHRNGTTIMLCVPIAKLDGYAFTYFQVIICRSLILKL
ncbi:hypothetical protein FEM48_Zijuj06G0012900 [Ziziphus jujuba var. spinosa]|uniref:SNRNP25 ubiquitin-like domain-containing protein n=1 Tax=Ziziphus jujuba var. spinosa TaxID=714518 RepID=A0A978V6C0_ZIZJJ|nr:hypothetical protein FEM48_Zijuj06G0012900 [Ziziphus jujuba var. spinosa]